jgi:flagellar hook-associated protein 2
MGRITSGIGLASGLDIQGIVNQLIAIESRPINLLSTRLAADKSRQAAFVGLSASLLSLQLSSGTLARPSLFGSRAVNSSNTDAIVATASTGAALGAYVVRPVQQARTHQLISSGFADRDVSPVGEGTIRVKLGGFVETTANLGDLNGGQDVARGKIRITDRSGASAVIDLSIARTVDDVLRAVNSATGIQVEASISGDRLVLTDLTGQSTSNLQVSEVSGGSTAAGLGLLGSVAAATLNGQDIVRLDGGTQLTVLNDGNGVRQSAGDDFRVTLRDGTTIDVDLGSAATIQDVLDLINSDSQNVGGALVASIGPDGDRLVLTDNSGGGGTLSVTELNTSSTAADLGILGSEQGAGVLTGTRTQAGLNTTLLSNLRGGSQTLTTGTIQVTRAGSGSVQVNLSTAESLADVITQINADAAGIGVKARINAAGDGIEILDSTGTNSALTIADNTGNLASYLNVAGTGVPGLIDSGDLSHRHVSQNTRLDALPGGQGFAAGRFRITNTAGAMADIDLTGSSIKTVGDVLQAINSAAIGVTASINATGDGILLTDTAAGSSPLTVTELGGTTAASLRLAGSGASQIDGAFRHDVVIDADDTLEDLAAKLVQSGAPLAVSVLNDGSGALPYRLFVSSTSPGQAGRLLIDPGTTGLRLSTLTEGADAVLEVGSSGTGGGLLLTSSNNKFVDALPGLTIEVTGTTAAPVSITVTQATETIASALDQFVENFNKTLSSINTLTAFDPLTGERGALQADVTVGQIRDRLLDLISGAAGNSTGTIRGFAQLGLTLSEGVLSINSEVLQARLTNDPQGVRDFLAAAESGAGVRLESALKGFTNAIDGAITRRVDAFDDRIAQLEERSEFLTARIEARRERLLAQFAEMERVLAQIQGQNTAITQLAQLATQFSNVNRNT